MRGRVEGILKKSKDFGEMDGWFEKEDLKLG